MNAKQAKAIKALTDALTAEMTAALAPKAIASEAGDEASFDAASDRIYAIQFQLKELEVRPFRRQGCNIRAALIEANID